MGEPAAITPAEVVLARELRGASRVDVRDVPRRGEPLAVRRRDAAHPAALDVNAVHLVLEQDRASGRAPDCVRDGVHEVEEMMTRVVRAAVVPGDEGDVQEKRDVTRREQVVAALPREDGAQPWRHLHVVVEILERPARVPGHVTEAIEAPQHAHGRESTRQLAGLRELGRDDGDGAEVAPDRRAKRRLRIASEEPRLELREAVRNAKALARDDRVIEAIGIEPHEGDTVDDAELAQERVHALSFRAAEDAMNLCAEAVVLQREGVRVAADHVVRLDHQDASARSREQRGDREARHARSDHDVVVVACRRARHGLPPDGCPGPAVDQDHRRADHRQP